VVKRLKNLKETKTKPPHLLFVGPAGCGKTSTAYAFANEIGYPVVELNASDERGIQVVREKIKRLALSYGKRIILLDEADNMTSDSQQALRRIMERANEDVIFILTGNNESKIIEPIKSRCAIFRFRKLSDRDSAKVLVKVLKGEGVTITQEVTKALMKLIKVTGGDLRKMLNELETIITKNNEISIESIELLTVPNLALQSLETIINVGDWKEALRRLEDAIVLSGTDMDEIINKIYRSVESIEAPLEVKLKIYDRLSFAEAAIKNGGDPVIQLAGFLAYVWGYVYSQKPGSELK